MNDPYMDAPPPARGCRKIACLGCLGTLGLLFVAAGAAAWFVFSQIRTVLTRFERDGYKVVTQRIIDVREPLTEPTIFFGQDVRVRKGSTRGLAFLCQAAEIDGHIEGNVHFMGQFLTVRPGAVLEKDLDVKGQVITVFGEVRGNITGTYQVLHRSGRPGEPPR
jgi:hypothetical protein